MTITKKSKKLLLELRRDRVQQLASRGYSQRDIAKQIGCSPALVNNDLRYLKARAIQSIKQYCESTLPMEMDQSLVRLRDIIKKAFEDIESTTTTTREKHDAMIIIKDSTALRLEILGSGVLADQLSRQQQQGRQAQQQDTQQDNETNAVS